MPKRFVMISILSILFLSAMQLARMFDWPLWVREIILTAQFFVCLLAAFRYGVMVGRRGQR